MAEPSVGGLNVAAETVDRHVAEGRSERVALRCLDRHGTRRDISFHELAELSSRAAAVLRGLGVGPGDVVATLLPRLPEFYVTALGAWKAGAVFCPLFSAFGPSPIRSRLELGRAKVLVTTEAVYTRKVAPQRATLPALAAVLVAGGGPLPEGCADFAARLDAADPAAGQTAPTTGDDPAFLHFTSGTTGTPKGAIHPHRTVLALRETGAQVFGMGQDDVYWCTADPGWVTATAYGIVAPLANGCVTLADEADFDPRRWYGNLRDEGVTAWYTTPTAIRLMMRHGAALARSYRSDALRVAASVGEPLNPEAVQWGERAFGVPFLDTWWQTETGAIVIANSTEARRPGSMGRPLPGIEIAVLRGPQPCADDDVGELALSAATPSLFTGYLGAPERFHASFRDGWYLTGDLVRRDRDGFVWFVGRSDDMIKSASHSIGPFEVECTLLDHPAVAEVGVVGKPDLMLREVPVAFVSLHPGFEPGEALRQELLAFARQDLGAALAPQEIHFVTALPKTATGKILRRTLKARAVGEADDDTLPVPSARRFDDE